MAETADMPAPRRVLIIKPSALGDVVTALPVLRGLRRSFGRDVRIDWMLSRACASLVAEEGDLDGVVYFDRRRLAKMWYHPGAMGAFLRFCRALRRAGYDWVIDLQGLFRSGFFARVCGADVRAGFGSARELAGLFYTAALPADQEPRHTVDRNIALARSLGVDARPEDFRLTVPSVGQAFAERFVREHGREYVVVAPATRWATKLYAPHHWKAVVAELARRWTVVLVAGADETHLAAPLAEVAGVIDLSGRTSIPEMTGLIAAAAGLVSCDSAPMNIAAALDTPQVTIIGPTDPARTGPYARPAAVVQTHLPCRACLRRTRRQCPHVSCMQTIAPAEVLAACERNFAQP